MKLLQPTDTKSQQTNLGCQCISNWRRENNPPF